MRYTFAIAACAALVGCARAPSSPDARADGVPVIGPRVGISVSASESASPPIAFIFVGESNAGGTAQNASATAGELAARPSVQIQYFTLGFQTLDIGVNNYHDHDTITGTQTFQPGGAYVTHGPELALANAVEAGTFGAPPVYLIKSGQGGSAIASWGAASPYWLELIRRTNAAKLALPTARWVCWYSQGLNNRFMPGDTAARNSWVAATVDLLGRIRTQLPGVKILMTEFGSLPYATGSDLDPAIREVVTTIGSPDVVSVDFGPPVEDGDSIHWSYDEWKNSVVPALVAQTLTMLEE